MRSRQGMHAHASKPTIMMMIDCEGEGRVRAPQGFLCHSRASSFLSSVMTDLARAEQRFLQIDGLVIVFHSSEIKDCLGL